MKTARRHFFVWVAFALVVPLDAAPAPARAANPPAAEELATDDEIVSLAAYNVTADRIEDFGLRVAPSIYSKYPKTTAGFFLSKFAPLIYAIVPNTAAAKAGLQPGDRIVKSDGQSTIGGVFSTGKYGQWQKAQKKKWAEVAAGKKNVTWTLEIETAGTKTLRTVKLVVPTPPPHWGSSVWRAPEGRVPAEVAEPGPLRELSRGVLDNGIWTALSADYARGLGLDFRGGAKSDLPSGREPNGFEWHLGSERGGGWHRIYVTQFRGRTDVFFETRSAESGRRIYLTSPSGGLEKAWRWTRQDNIARAKAPKKDAAARTGEVPLEEARVGFAHEVDLWTTKVDRGIGRWPFEVKPDYDANAIFAVLAAEQGGPAAAVVRRPLAAEFLKLRAATEAERTMFADAYGQLGAEHDRWAYTETARGLEDKRVLVMRVDPSKPEDERCVLLSVDGQAPTAEDVERWRDVGGDTPKPLGDLPPIASLVELRELRVFKEDAATVVFELPLRSDNAEFPAEKFQALFRVNKGSRSLEEITIRLRDTFRVAGVVKVTEAGMEVRLQTIDPAFPPQVVQVKAGGGVRVLLVKFSRAFEATRTDFKRVEAPAEETTTPATSRESRE